MLLCSVAGFDASHRVDDLASAMGKPCTPIALGNNHLLACVVKPCCNIVLFFLGSAEGFSLAEKAISSASRNGK